MKSDHGRGSFPMVQLPWSHILNNQFTKVFGLSLGVNRMWSKRNDHASKSECADFFKYMSNKGSFEEKKKHSSLTMLLSSFVFVFLSPPKKISSKFYFYSMSLPWALAFFHQSTSFASPTSKPVGPCQWIM